MKWKHVFDNPDVVGSSEYGAIHECIANVVFGVDGDAMDPDVELSAASVQAIEGMLQEFHDYIIDLRRRLRIAK